MTEPVRIVDYDPAWAFEFDRLRDRLLAAFSDLVVSVEHVGSTAVPGLAAKPILDMDVVLHSRDQLQDAIARLANIGYTHVGDLGISGREAFANPTRAIEEDAPDHHLYLVVRGSEAWRNHIQFRDYLRDHPETAQAYAVLKRSLAETFQDNRDQYTQAKTEFVETILRATRSAKPWPRNRNPGLQGTRTESRRKV